MRSARFVAPFESYVLFPSIVALCVVGIDRSGLGALLKFPLFLGLYIAAGFVSRWSGGLFIVFAAVLLERSLFFHPIVTFGAGVGLGLYVYLQETHEFQPRIGIVIGLISSLGLFPLLASSSGLRWIIVPSVVVAFAASLLMLALGTLQITELATNSREYLDRNPNPNRLILFCVFFLVLGAPLWGQLVEILDFRIAAVLYLAIAALVPTTLLAIVRLPFGSIQRAEVLPVVVIDPDLEKRIAALEAEKRRLERQQLLDRERAFYFELPWDQLVARFSNQLETTLPDGSIISARDHVLMGIIEYEENGDTRYRPAFLRRDILSEHIHIMGGTGSRKTSQAITPILINLIRGYAVPDAAGEISVSDPHPIVILDIKGDSALFHTAKEEARRRGQEFLFFTVDSTKPSHYFNPFLALRRHKATVSEQAHQLLDSLSLNYGEGYGKSYFTRIGRQALLQILRVGETPQSLREVYARLKNDPKKQKKAEELFAALEGLIDYPQLFTTKYQEEIEPEKIIDFDRVLERNQVVYFSLSAPTQSMAVREIGKLAIYSFFLAAIHRYSNSSTKQAYLIIDEFQRLVGENLAQVLEQAREFGIGAILANQTISQLDTPDGNLWSLINGCVRASLHFGSADPDEKKLLSQASGEVIEELRSTTITKSASSGGSKGTALGSNRSATWGFGLGSSETKGTSETSSFSESWSESHAAAESREQIYRPRFTFESIGEWWNKRGRYFLWVRAASGLSDFGGRPIKVLGLFTVDFLTHLKRKNSPWPEDGPRPSFDREKGKPGRSRQELLAAIDDNFIDQ
jgi:hypothetical protein